MTLKRRILDGLTGLRQHLESKRSHIPAPILLIQSHPAVTNSKNVHDACRHVEFMISQQLGFRAITSTIASAYPVDKNRTESLELAHRVGASGLVVGVGSGCAMDLTKTLVSNNTWEECILVPATYPACLAATSSHALILDTAEEALDLTPPWNSNDSVQQDITEKTRVVVLQDTMLVDTSRQDVILYASLAIGLDAIYQGRQSTQTDELMETALECLEQTDKLNPQERHELVMQTALEAGSLVSYGISAHHDHARSIPLALAVALVPRYFSQYDIVSFMASLLPALCELVTESNDISRWVSRIQPHLSNVPRLVVASEASNLESLLQSVHASQALWNSQDVTDDVYRYVLQKSICSGSETVS